MKAEYYLIKDKYLGKYEDRVYYLLKEEGWSEDKDGYIKGIQIGYDASDDDTPYAIGNIEIMDQIKEISKEEANDALEKLGHKKEPMFSVGQFVRYIGDDLVAYEKGKAYMITGYDEKLDMFGVWSELDEDYLLPVEILEELSDEEEREYDEQFYESLLDDLDDEDDDLLLDENGNMMSSNENLLYITPYKKLNVIDNLYKYNYDDCILKNIPFDINKEYEIEGKKIESYSGYPPSGMWIMNKEQLKKFINKYSELCSSIDIDDLKEDKYVLSFVYWD